MISRLQDRVAQAPLLLDSAMGTALIAWGLDLSGGGPSLDDPCLWVESHPDAVLAVHQSAVAAGAEALFTDTFGANDAWFDLIGSAADVAALNWRAVTLARRAAGPDRFVIGSIGPTSLWGEPAALLRQAEILVDAGVDALALETFRHDGAVVALNMLRGINRPVWVGLFDWPEAIGAAMAALTAAGAALVGLNCTARPDLIDRFLAALAEPRAPTGWIKPSGGGPGEPPLTEETFAASARRIARIGRGAMGGCCGTTADHLRAIGTVWSDEATRGTGGAVGQVSGVGLDQAHGLGYDPQASLDSRRG